MSRRVGEDKAAALYDEALLCLKEEPWFMWLRSLKFRNLGHLHTQSFSEHTYSWPVCKDQHGPACSSARCMAACVGKSVKLLLIQSNDLCITLSSLPQLEVL